MRKGYSLIELIFVFIILGIITVVAIPHFLTVAQQSRDVKIEEFVGTLNNTTGSTMWGKSIKNGYQGKISGEEGGDMCRGIQSYINIPIGLIDNFDCTFSPEEGSGIGVAISFQDGNQETAPEWKTYKI